MIEYREWISEQSTDKLESVFIRLREDQHHYEDVHDEPDYMTAERLLSVEIELRRRGCNPSALMD